MSQQNAGQAWFKITARSPIHKQNYVYNCEQMSQQEAESPDDFIEINEMTPTESWKLSLESHHIN